MGYLPALLTHLGYESSTGVLRYVVTTVLLLSSDLLEALLPSNSCTSKSCVDPGCEVEPS